jgi:hypothetical protein
MLTLDQLVDDVLTDLSSYGHDSEIDRDDDECEELDRLVSQTLYPTH